MKRRERFKAEKLDKLGGRRINVFMDDRDPDGKKDGYHYVIGLESGYVYFKAKDDMDIYEWFDANKNSIKENW